MQPPSQLPTVFFRQKEEPSNIHGFSAHALRAEIFFSERHGIFN